jgi:hypothetical protein
MRNGRLRGDSAAVTVKVAFTISDPSDMWMRVGGCCYSLMVLLFLSTDI